MYLCFDIGNTTIEIALCETQTIIKKYKIDTNTSECTKTYERIFRNEIGKITLEGIIISSVVPSINEKIVKAIENVYNITPMFVSNDLNHNINIKIDNPHELGNDLLISSVAAAKKYSGNKLIIDLGTANKLLIVKGNDFMGGAIAPGFKSSLNSLFNDAEKLTHVPIKTPKNVVGNSTITCIQSGIIYGTVSMIEGMINRMEEEVGSCKVLLTGGNSEYVKDVLKCQFEYCPNLLIEGLMELYERNKQN